MNRNTLIKNLQKTIRLLTVSFSITLIGANAHGSQDFKNLSGQNIKSEQLDKKLNALIQDSEVPGLAVAVVDETGITYMKSIGYSNIETKEKIDEDSVFEAASLSKPMFAYFAMRLAEAGKFDLNKPLYDYIPHPGFEDEFSEQAKSITGLMALAHTTGMPNWSGGEKMALSGTPGEVFSYSGEAYQYLTAAIGTHQKLGWDQKLDAQIQSMVFEPLEMTNTSFVWNEKLASHKVYGHKDGKVTDNESIGNGKSVGAGYSLHSNIKDYAKFVQAMINQQGLTPETWSLMLENHIALPADHDGRQIGQIGWSLGFAVKQTEDGLRYVHTGNNHDFQSYVEFDPINKVGIVYFTNSNQGSAVYNSLSEIMEL